QVRNASVQAPPGTQHTHKSDEPASRRSKLCARLRVLLLCKGRPESVLQVYMRGQAAQSDCGVLDKRRRESPDDRDRVPQSRFDLPPLRQSVRCANRRDRKVIAVLLLAK